MTVQTEFRRREENMLAGFDMIVVDVDDSVTMETAKMLLKGYKWLLHTTKRHTPAKHRFRMIFPIKYHLELEAQDFKEFMNNFYEWLPFEVDRSTNQRSRKWLTSSNGYHEYSEGHYIDALQFVPKTRKNEERQKQIEGLKSLSAVERWFAKNIEMGNRSNQLVKYALMLVDTGMEIEEIQDKVLSFNSKLEDSLPEEEISRTILITVSKAIAKRGSK